MNKGTDKQRFLGSVFSSVPADPGDTFTRPSAGGGGLGDPLLRDPKAVLEDVIDGYVSLERAAKDYGVVVHAIDPEIDDYALDVEATDVLRRQIRADRQGWLDEDPEDLARRYRDGEVDMLDMIRRYGVIVDWGTGELLPQTTRDFRAGLRRRSLAHWHCQPWRGACSPTASGPGCCPARTSPLHITHASAGFEGGNQYVN
jgi:N-methylhydantoinase B